jgi:hypothetical protein
MNRWKVIKRNNRWRVLDGGAWHETHDTLVDAHTAATQNAVAADLYSPGGLTCLATLRQREREWIVAKEGALHPPLAEWEKELLYCYHEARVPR